MNTTTELTLAGDSVGEGLPDRQPTTGGGWRFGWLDAISLGLVILALAVPLRGLLRYQGPPMEEGFMLAFPQEVLRGSIPNRDFLHLYGPGSLWVLAGVFKVFGTSLATERWFGLLQHAGIIFGVWAVARHWGRRTATVCALVSLVVVVPPIGLTALAWNGAVALALWSVYLLAQPGRGGSKRPIVAGLLAGLALLFRPDLVLALSLGLGAAVWRPTMDRVRPVLTGLVAGASPMLVHIVMAGPEAAFKGMFVEPVFRLRPGRSLPVPPSWTELDGFLQKAAGLRTIGWPFPAPTSAQQVALWFFLVPVSTVFVAAVGIWSCRRRPGDQRSHLLRAVGFLGLGMLTQAMQRPDTAHFAWVSCVPLALVPVAVHQLLPAGWPAVSWRRFVATTAPVVIVVFAAIPHYTVRTYVDLAGQSLGRNVFGFPVNHEGRNFYYGSPDAAAAANELVRDLGEWSQPGESLLVGPVDFRFTPYSDAFFYFLFPDLVPATRYIEMDPGIANGHDSGLADEVRSADWLILSNVWTNWAEPNASLEPGSDAPNQVVKDHFCRVGAYGDRDGRPWFELYRPCDRIGDHGEG
ncbi:MAG: glycosyltransferase family 39 protein [Microthrixaceae bacterium]|nr:glycosyltransferase family 39 protein [Acidimicrobiales bacterium]MCB9404200.1 glycosyltransferase family 39 protein [Microthrixaceae bacterium]